MAKQMAGTAGAAGKTGSRWVALALAALVAAAGVAAAVYLLTRPGSGMEMEDNATVGILPGVDLDQRLKELQNTLDESMIAFSINTNPVFSSGDAEGNLMIENPSNNAKLLVAELFVEGDSEPVYRSKAIRPGTYIENARLQKRLEKGVYEVTAYLKAYKEDTQEYIGQTGASILLTVQA